MQKKEKCKPHINLVLLGHVDVGKSTTMGNLIWNTGCLTEER